MIIYYGYGYELSRVPVLIMLHAIDNILPK